MLIPSIDLQGGAVVQLVQGERLAIRDEDIFKWVRRFERFPKVQVIDLDAAMGRADNLAIVKRPRAGSPRREALRRRKRSTTSTRTASIRSSGWRFIRGSFRFRVLTLKSYKYLIQLALGRLTPLYPT